MQWLRLYDDVLDDPKVQQLKPELFKYWINLLCLANKNDPRGHLPIEWTDIAFRLRVTPAKAVAIIRELVHLELIDEGPVTFRPHGWDERQRKSDNVAERVAKHRGNVTRNVTETVSVTPPDTDTDTETETETEQNRTERTTPPTPSPGEEKPKRTRSVKTPVPDDLDELIPVDVWAVIGEEQQLTDEQLQFETSLMIDHYQGKGERRADWVATWRGWMRSPYRKTKSSGPPGYHLPPGLELPPGVTVQQLDEWVEYRKARISLPPDREVLVDRYLSALNGGAVA